MEGKEDVSTELSAKVIGQGFSNQLKKLSMLNEHSPRIFIVHAYSLSGEEGPTKWDLTKEIQSYLNPTVEAPCPSRDGHLKLNLYSAIALQGNETDAYNEYREADVLYSQMCLLPKHPYSVDYVIICGACTLEEYAEIQEVKEYTKCLRKILSSELSKTQSDFDEVYTKAESALNTLKSKCKESHQRFHLIYTELAFSILRKEEKEKEGLPANDLIMMITDGSIEASGGADAPVYIGTSGRFEQDPKAFYLRMFELLKRLFGRPDLRDCRRLIEKVQREFMVNTDLPWTPKDIKELNEQHCAHKERKTSKQRKKAKRTFFAPSSSSSAEVTLNEQSSSTTPLSHATIPDLDSSELKASLQAIYKQNATLPRLFSEEVEAISDTFVNVSILKEEVVKAKEKELDDTHKGTQDNRLHSHERLYQVHEPISIEKLFAPLSTTQSPQKLLLYGRAGIGKTVLCQYLANQWAEERLESFQQFQAVFWIKLRELMERLQDRRNRGRPINEEMIVAEMITICCLIDTDWQKEMKKQQLELWLKAHAEQTLFILDGYDEVAETASVGDLGVCLRVMLDKQIQHRPYVMLTSRPIAIDSHYSSFDRRLECMGFTDKNIKVFTQRYFANQQQSSSCLTFLKAHPSIWSTAHIPINLELICWLWSRGELSTNNQCLTMAALYTEIMEKTGRENAKKYPLLKKSCYQGYDKKSRVTKTIANLANDFLSFLGFYAMQQSGVLLPGKKIQRWLHEFISQTFALHKNKREFDAEVLLTACLHLGLLKSTQEGGRHLFDYRYYFIHLSFQEFFAAKYYQQAFEYLDIEVIEHFATHKYTPSYQLTWWMSSGLLYHHKNYSGLKVFFKTLCSNPLDLIGVHHFSLLSRCLDECQADESVEVVARLLEHQATFLEHYLEEWLIKAWESTLLHSPNLLRSSQFQKAGLRLVQRLKKINDFSDGADVVIFLVHLYPQAISYLTTDTAINSNLRKKLAKVLIRHPGLVFAPDEAQYLIAFLADTTVNTYIVKYIDTLAEDSIEDPIHNVVICLMEKKAIDGSVPEELFRLSTNNPNLTLRQLVPPFIAYLADTSLDGSILGKLIQCSDLTANQAQYFISCLKDTTINGHVRRRIAKMFPNRPEFPEEQIQSLINLLLDTTIKSHVRRRIAEMFAKCPEFTEGQIQPLINLLLDTTINNYVRGYLAIGLVQCSDLIAEEIQSIFACLADITIDDYIRRELATSLAQRSNLTEEQIQNLIKYLLGTTITCRFVLRAFVKAVVACSGLTSEQVQNLIDCLKDTTIYPEVRGWVAVVLGQRSNRLLDHQVQSIFACLPDVTIDDYIRGELATGLAQCPNLTAGQFHNLLIYLADTTSRDGNRLELARLLAKRSGLIVAQIQSFIDYLADTTIHGKVREILAEVLIQRSNLLTEEQFNNVINCLKDATLDIWSRRRIAEAFARSSSLSTVQIRSFVDCLVDITNHDLRAKLVIEFAKCPEFTEEQLQRLLIDTAINSQVHAEFTTVLAGRSELTEEQIQHLLTDTTINTQIRIELARVLAARLDLTADQIQPLLAFLANKAVASYARREFGNALAQSFAQRSNLDIAQLQQLLVYSLKRKTICKKHPDLIFQILLVYYSNTQIKQLEFKASSKLCIFLTSSSAWFALLRQQALLVYDQLSSTVQLHLQGQMIEFSVKKKFFNQFLTLTCKTWRGNLHQDILNDKKAKHSLLNLIAKKNKSQVSTEQPPSVRYITDENKRITQLNSIRKKKGSVGLRQERPEIKDSRQKAKPVIITTSTTTMPSLTVASTMPVVPVHHKSYETTVLPDTGNTLWADINVPADNTCLFYAVTLGALLPALEEMEEFARCFRALFGEDNDDEAILQLQNCLKSFDGTDDFIQHHSAPLEVLVNVALRQRVVHVMRQNPAAYQEKLALEIATRDVRLLTEDDYEDYLQKMENPKGSWGGLIEVGVMSQLLNIPILTYEQEGLHFVPKDVSSNSQGRVIRIALTKASSLATHNNHFHVFIKPKHILLKINKTVSYSDNKYLESYSFPSQNTFFSGHHSHTATSKPQGLTKNEEASQLTRKTKSFGDNKETCKH